jgi:hypothetical protein
VLRRREDRVGRNIEKRRGWDRRGGKENGKRKGKEG